MLIHICPRIRAPFGGTVELLEVEIRKFGLHLDERSVTARRPYPNKMYWVTCRNKGRKAIDGLFFETKEPVDSFNVRTAWAIQKHYVLTHNVEYRILDHDFDAASDEILLWHGCGKDLGNWSSRLPVGFEKWPAPMYSQPTMDVFAGEMHRPNTKDEMRGELIVNRTQVFTMPTIERERLVKNVLNDRLPDLADAFKAKPLSCRVLDFRAHSAPERPASFRTVLSDHDIPF